MRLPLQLTDNAAGIGFHQIPIEGTTPSIELSEAECDIDTLKKLKIGMRSSLWSRPMTISSGGGGGSALGNVQPSSHPSDYSIAV